MECDLCCQDDTMSEDKRSVWCPLRPIDLDAIEEENPYRIIGQRETYSQYNEGWQDATGRIRRELGL